MREISLNNLDINVFTEIGNNWMLISAGEEENWNTMTASWGSLGHLWNRNIATIYVRKSRYTYEFIENNDYFTLSFFNKNYKKALSFCGSHSGRNYDKAKETGLNLIKVEKSIAFNEAKLVLLCKKIYFQDLDKNQILDNSVHSLYHENDYHRVYIGEIIKVLSD